MNNFFLISTNYPKLVQNEIDSKVAKKVDATKKKIKFHDQIKRMSSASLKKQKRNSALAKLIKNYHKLEVQDLVNCCTVSLFSLPILSISKVTRDVEINFRGLGLSLVNNVKGLDLMYIGIASSSE